MKPLHLICALNNTDLYGWPDYPKIRDFDFLTKVAQRAEACCFDALLFEDRNSTDDLLLGQPAIGLEPWTTFAALATVTQHIGLIVTASTTDNQPYNVARRLASLDHISQGRAGWFVVTGNEQQTEQQYDCHLSFSEQYQRGSEFVNVTRALWDSWSGSSIVIKENGLCGVDGSKNRPINHQGHFFKVKGPLDIPRPPQGYPVFSFQGKRAEAMSFAAPFTELIFMEAQEQNIAALQEKWYNVCEKAKRNTEQLRFMPTLNIVLDHDSAVAQNTRKTISMNHADVLTFTGTPTDLVNTMIEYMDHLNIDGFKLVFPQFEKGFTLFTDEVIPQLQEKKQYRTRYKAKTLRDHLKLPNLYHQV